MIDRLLQSFIAFIGNGENLGGRFPRNLTELDEAVKEYVEQHHKRTLASLPQDVMKEVVARSTWREIAPPSIDSGYVLLYTHFGIPQESNYTKIYFDKGEEELVRINMFDGIPSWWKTNPWLDAG